MTSKLRDLIQIQIFMDIFQYYIFIHLNFPQMHKDPL